MFTAFVEELSLVGDLAVSQFRGCLILAAATVGFGFLCWIFFGGLYLAITEFLQWITSKHKKENV